MNSLWKYMSYNRDDNTNFTWQNIVKKYDGVMSTYR